MRIVSVLTALLIAAPAAADPMAEYLWSDRPIIIFAPSKYDQRLLDQIGRFSMHRKEYRDRDIKVIRIGGVNMQVDGTGVPHAPVLREKYGVPKDEFAVILVGKDGGEKMRVSEPTDPRVFYDLIDTMPMRQEEMRREGS
ncbi:MAG: DUF4174 domain-containing protein [Pseudomonadota bacterium]